MAFFTMAFFTMAFSEYNLNEYLHCLIYVTETSVSAFYKKPKCLIMDFFTSITPFKYLKIKKKYPKDLIMQLKKE